MEQDLFRVIYAMQIYAKAKRLQNCKALIDMAGIWDMLFQVHIIYSTLLDY
jgi:hypothetical protein